MMKNLRFFFLSMMVMLGMNAYAEDVIWQEDWSSVTEFKVDPSNFNSNYTFTGFTLKEDGSFSSGTTFYNENLAGGTAPELLVAKNGGSFAAKVALNGKSGDMVLRFKSNKTLTVTIDGATLGESTKTGNDYLYPVTVAGGTSEITITFTQSQSQNARLDDIELYQGAAKKPAGLSWGKASTSLTLGEEVTLKLSNENNLPVSYTSSEETVATINSEGVVTLVAVGKTILTATFDGNDEYEAQSVSIEVTVKEAGGDTPGPQPTGDVISVAKALEIIEALENGKTTTEVYQVKGFVVGTPDFQRKADGTLYGNVNFDMADEKGGATKLTVFRAKGFDGAAFTEETINQFKEDDEVVFEGKLQKYVKNEAVTPELTNGKLISVNGNTNGVYVIKAAAVNAPVYNLAGQRVEKAVKGLYIQNGRKFVVK
jgi:hypothetical protein